MHQGERDDLEPDRVGAVLAPESPQQPAAEEELPGEQVDARVDEEAPHRTAVAAVGVVGLEVRQASHEPDGQGHDDYAADGNE